MEQLRDTDPEGWPETVAKLVGVVGGMDTTTMDLMCDATTQVAAIAHQLSREQEDEEGDGGARVERN